MLLQLIDPSADWIVVLALIFGLSIFMTVLTDPQVDTFMAFFTIFVGFAVYANLLDLWVLILFLIIITILILINIKNSRGF